MKTILRRHPFILLFGILQIFFSAPGQTFLISLFINQIFGEMGISLSLFAGLYSAATLSASLLLSPAGHLIDKYDIKKIVVGVCCAMALGCWLLAGATNVMMLFAAFFILRLIGQGVFGLAAGTLIVKKFQKNRGKAMGLSVLGFPLSEAVYPAIALFLIRQFGWRITYVVFGFSMVVLMLPIQYFLLAKAKLKHGHFLPGEELINPQSLPGRVENAPAKTERDATLAETLRDVKFYLLLIGATVPPLVVTGLFFHQQTLFDTNGWPIALAAVGFAAYAFCKAVGSLCIGPVVDRHGPLVPFLGIIVLLAGGTFLAGLGGPEYAIYIYFSLLGAALGFSSPVMNVVWPLFYGVEHMGSIKGIIATVRNGLTALGPLPVALALDAGYSINQVLMWSALGVLILTTFPVVAWKMKK